MSTDISLLSFISFSPETPSMLDSEFSTTSFDNDDGFVDLSSPEKIKKTTTTTAATPIKAYNLELFDFVF